MILYYVSKIITVFVRMLVTVEPFLSFSHTINSLLVTVEEWNLRLVTLIWATLWIAMLLVFVTQRKWTPFSSCIIWFSWHWGLGFALLSIKQVTNSSIILCISIPFIYYYLQIGVTWIAIVKASRPSWSWRLNVMIFLQGDWLRLLSFIRLLAFVSLIFWK